MNRTQEPSAVLGGATHNPTSMRMRRASYTRDGLWEISLVVQRLRLHASTAGGRGSIPGQETKISQSTWFGYKKKKRKNVSCLPGFGILSSLVDLEIDPLLT